MAEKCIKCGCDDPAMTKLIQGFGRCNERLDGIEDKLNDICQGLNGQPDEPHKGLMVRVDRLEQKISGTVKLLWIVITSSVGLILSKFVKGD